LTFKYFTTKINLGKENYKKLAIKNRLLFAVFLKEKVFTKCKINPSTHPRLKSRGLRSG